MQVILDSSFARPGSAPIRGGKKGEFRDWTRIYVLGLIDMFLINLNAEIVACILSFRKSRHKPNLGSTSKYGFSPDLGEKNGGVLNMRMQVILDSSFARPGSAPIWGKKVEFRDWTRLFSVIGQTLFTNEYFCHFFSQVLYQSRSTVSVSQGSL